MDVSTPDCIQRNCPRRGAHISIQFFHWLRRRGRFVAKNDRAGSVLHGQIAQRAMLRFMRAATAATIFFLPHAAAATGIFRPRDFAPAAAWNTPIRPGAAMHPAEGVALLPVGLDTWLDADAWTVPCYQASASDPPHRLIYSADAWVMVARGLWRRSGNPPEIEAAILAGASPVFPPTGNVFSSISATAWVLPAWMTGRPRPHDLMFRFAPDMRPAAGADGHRAVGQPNGLVVETYATIVLASGDVVALSASVTDPASLGDGRQNGQTASMLPDYAGLFQDDDIATGIDHAMAITVPAKLLAPSAAYPAAAFDRGALTEQPPYAGTLPMGARLALPPLLRIDSLSLRTQAGRAIATAAQSYGFIVVDRGGGGITLRVRPNAAHPRPELHAWNRDLQADLRAIFAAVQHVQVATLPP